MRTILILGAVMMSALAAAAEIPTVPDELTRTKTPPAEVLTALKNRREQLLKTPLESVTFGKKVVAPSGDKRDYISVGIYWWPDPEKADGLPYIRRDGQVNPEWQNYDCAKSNRMYAAVRDIALLYYFTGDKELAAHGVKLLKVFFTDPETGMNPHLKYAQSIPGREDGRAIGIIDTYIWIDLVDSIAMLKDAMTPEDYRALQQWFGKYLDWLRSDAMTWAFLKERNNITIAYYAQMTTYAVFSGKSEIGVLTATQLRDMVGSYIRRDGIFPEEITRTKSWDYSIYALNILFSAIPTAKELGIDILSPDSESGKRTRAAVDYLCSFIDKPDEWPYEQLYGAININALGPILRKMYYFTGEAKYRDHYRALKKPQSDLMTSAFYSVP